MSEMKRRIIEHHLKREIDEMKAQYPKFVIDAVFSSKEHKILNFAVLRYRVGQMIDNDMDPEPIMDHISNYKLELYDAVMEYGRKAEALEPDS